MLERSQVWRWKAPPCPWRGQDLALYLRHGNESAVFSKPPVDAHDASGAKAPGKPAEDDGFIDPKDGEKWVNNPNGKGSGWLDKNGNVWVPTGWGAPAHGGPHWDVQHPDGSHANVYPGGRQR